MRWTAWYGLALLLLFGGCAPRRPAMAELPTNEALQPEVGIIRWVESRRISLDLVGAELPRRYVRTRDSQVLRGGEEVSWAELEVGQAVRFQAVKGPFSPARITAIEILQGDAEAGVRAQILASSRRSERPSPPGLRNLQVSVGRGS